VAVLVTGIIVLTLLAMLGSLFLPEGWGAVAVIGGYLVVPIGGTLLWIFFLPEADEFASRTSRWDHLVAIDLQPPWPVDLGDVRSVSGKVVAQQTLRSPIAEEPCVAFRLTGAAGRFAIDDAKIIPFELELGDGSIARVEGDDATVELEAPDGARQKANDALIDFLDDLGIDGDDDLRLGESLLRAGDQAEVRGHAVESDQAGSGYRGSRTLLTFHDIPEVPLVIRRAR
jgi:hypothetical protein